MTHRQHSLLACSLAVAATFSLAACSDMSTAPSVAPRTVPQVHLAKGGNGGSTFVLDPSVDNTLSDSDGNSVIIPAGSICDPQTSGYGPTLWNSPCDVATKPITFKVSMQKDVNGHPQLTISPDVRFEPSHVVTYSVNDKKAAANRTSYIAWCTFTGCYNEGLTDPDMATDHDPAAGYVRRRLKHFSGYNVVFGFDSCDGSSLTCSLMRDGSSDDSSEDPSAPTHTLSGYITTTGRQ